ncbi:putative phage tail protein [Anaerosporobacter sp.]|uniref:putative phage tail protein n=1 Tax=Anaerosporobacter sp. TaxID=1872529 RepID=UPI00286F16E8|nr:putative phage tail protein [Anaerosporobacter sp.]
MAKEVDLLSYQSEIIQAIREFKVLSEIENPQHECVWKAVEDAVNDQFATSLTENGCKRWESIMDIQAKDTDEIDFRRFRILSRLNEQLPYSYRMLELQLRTLCGDDGYRLMLKNEEYTLIVKIALTSKNKYSDVEDTLRKYVPANIMIDISLLYNTYEILSQFTHGQLADYTHYDLREEVISNGNTNK